MGLKQIFVSHAGATGSSGGNNSASCPFLTFAWSPGFAPAVVAAAGTFRKLRVRVNSAPGVGKGITFVLQRNKVNTSISVSITGTDVEGTDFDHEETFAAGDTIRLFRTQSPGVLASYAQCSIEWEGTNDTDSIYGTMSANSFADANRTNSIFSGEHTWTNTTADNHKQVVPVAGDLKDLYVQLQSPVGAGNSVTITTFLNGVAQDGSGGTPDTRVTIAGGSATTGHAAFTLPLAVGDLVHNQVTYVGSTTVRIGLGYRFTSGTPHRYIIAGIENEIATGTQYGSPQETWDAGFGVNETVKQSIAGGSDFTVFGLIVRLQTPPGGAASRTFTLRKNAFDTALTVTLGPTDTLVSSGVEVPVTSGQTLTLKHTNAGVGGGFPTPTKVWYSLMGGGATAPAPHLQKITQQVLLTGHDADADPCRREGSPVC